MCTLIFSHSIFVQYVLCRNKVLVVNKFSVFAELCQRCDIDIVRGLGQVRKKP